MKTRDTFTSKGIDTDQIDHAIDSTFLPETHAHLDSALKLLEELRSIGTQMAEWKIDCAKIERAMALVFDPGYQMVCIREIERWHNLKEMRGQLTARRMTTNGIDRALSDLFQASTNA